LAKPKIDVILSEDKMRAFITIDNEGDSFPPLEEIETALKESGVVYGIDESVLERLVKRKQRINFFQVAEGDPPEGGEDSRLIWHVDSAHSTRPKIDESGKADYWGTRKILQINKGDDIVTKIPSTEGVPGKTVTGEAVAVQGKDVPLPEGKNVMLSDDGLTLQAAADGHLEYENGKVIIKDVYRIPGDVDFSTGNVKYKGKIHIKGDVRSGFRVEASDGITIDGNVEAAHIYCRDGDIHIGRGIVGKGRAYILAGGNLHCGYIQDARVNINKNIFIKHYTMNSDIYAGEEVLLTENEGLIRGGKVHGEKGIRVKEIGSIHKIPTEIGLESYNYSNVDTKLKQLLQDEKAVATDLALVTKKVKFLNLLRQRLGGLSPQKENDLAEVVGKAKELQERLNAIKAQQEELNTDSQKTYSDSVIVVEGKIHQGVRVMIGQLEHYIEQLYRGVKIRRDADSIIIEKL